MKSIILKKHSIFGILSLVVGLVSLTITVIIIIALDKITGGTVDRNITFFVNTLNLFSDIEIFVKFTGILLGLIGLFHKNRKKITSFLGLIVNISTIIWTLIIIYMK